MRRWASGAGGGVAAGATGRAEDPARLAAIATAGVVLATALAGCAPVALYRGPAPAPGAITSFAGGDWPHVVAGSTDAARHYLGALETPPGADSLVVLIYGDNRPGARTRVHPTLWRAVRKMSLTNPYRLGRGLLLLSSAAGYR